MNTRFFGLSMAFALGCSMSLQAAEIFNQDRGDSPPASSYFTSQRQRSDHSGSSDNVMADDFYLPQPASINQVNVRGKFGVDFGSGVDVVNSVIVKFYSDSGSAEGSPSAGSPLYTATINGAFIPVTIQGSEAPGYQLQIPLTTPFAASATTKYWVSVQPVTNNPGSTWLWDWNNDEAHPTTYSPSGSAASQSSGGSWNANWGRWWHTDAFNGDSWKAHTFAGAFSTTDSGDTDGQRLDLNFVLLGEFSAAPEPSGIALATISFAGLGVVARRRRRNL